MEIQREFSTSENEQFHHGNSTRIYIKRKRTISSWKFNENLHRPNTNNFNMEIQREFAWTEYEQFQHGNSTRMCIEPKTNNSSTEIRRECTSTENKQFQHGDSTRIFADNIKRINRLETNFIVGNIVVRMCEFIHRNFLLSDSL